MENDQKKKNNEKKVRYIPEHVPEKDIKDKIVLANN
jgi:hypothetical protein